MTRFNVGDVITYSNKKKRIDNIVGEVIAIYEGYAYQVKPVVSVEPTPGSPRFYRRQDIHHTHRRNISEYEPVGTSSHPNWYRSRDLAFSVPISSRNLKFALKTYDPSQNGDTEEDI
jgi:hypothetical protein